MHHQNNDDQSINSRPDVDLPSNEGVSASRADVACRSSRAPGSLSTFPDLLNVQNSSSDSQNSSASDNSHLTNFMHIHGYLSSSIDRPSRPADSADLLSQSRQTGAIPKARSITSRSTVGDDSSRASKTDVDAHAYVHIDDVKPASKTTATALRTAACVPPEAKIEKALNADSSGSKPSPIKLSKTSSNLTNSSTQDSLDQMQRQLSSVIAMIERTNSSIDQLHSRLNQRLDSIESSLSSICSGGERSSGSRVSSNDSSSANNIATLLNQQRQDLVQERTALLVGLSEALRVTASSISKDQLNEPHESTSNGQRD